jgi:hypothetical protein
VQLQISASSDMWKKPCWNFSISHRLQGRCECKRRRVRHPSFFTRIQMR